MYLRLKPYTGNPFDSELEIPAASIRDTLIKRHYGNFDWSSGGQIGQLKFIDSHQLEYAAGRALAGEHLSRVMVDVTIDGIRSLIGRHGGASQYATGGSWNDSNHAYRLDGQAVFLQALAWHGLITKRSNAYKLGSHLAQFVAANGDRLGLLPSHPRYRCDQTNGKDGKRIRDNAWYAIGLAEFARVFGDHRLARCARGIFRSSLASSQGDSTLRAFQVAQPTLDDKIALAAAMLHFGACDRDQQQIRDASALALDIGARYRCDGGGYGQIPRKRLRIDRTIDIDCTIELVRLAVALTRLLSEPRLDALVQHGLDALWRPNIALARPCESGILLIALECEATSTDPDPAIVAARKITDSPSTNRPRGAISGPLEEIS